MKKNLFIKCINAQKAFDDYLSQLDDLNIRIWETNEVQNIQDAFLELLEYVCHEKPNELFGSDISYFMYDTQYGEKSDKFYITEADGTEIHLKTVEDLWDYLISVHPEIEDKEDEERSNI